MNYRVVFSIDNNFAPYLAVTIQSLIDNSSCDKNYIVSVLSNNLSIESKNNLASLEKANIKIEFYDVKEKLEELNINFLNEAMHWSIATYYRILIPFLFPDDKKVLYLDCDMICLCDIAEIFENDLGKNSAGVVLDFDTVCYPEKRIKYIQNELKPVEYEKYFNAGLVLFNIEKIDKEEYKNTFLKLSAKKFKFLDQDILNIMFNGHVLLLDMEWNYQYHFLFEELKERYNFNLNAPKIIHYTTSAKPWNAPWRQLSYYWWQFARKTYCYEEIIYKNTIVDFAAANKCMINFIYTIYKLLALAPFPKFKTKIKKRIKKIKPYVEITRKF